MLIGSDNIPPYERQLIWILLQSVVNSPELDQSQKTRIESRLQEIVGIWKERK